MGQKASLPKPQVKVSLPQGCLTVNTVRLSYKSATYWGKRRRRIAQFKFPQGGWAGEEQGPITCIAKGGSVLPLAALRKKDGSTPVRVKLLAGGTPVVKTSLPLERLLAMVEEPVQGNQVLLHFALAGEDNKELYINGWPCGEIGETQGRDLQASDKEAAIPPQATDDIKNTSDDATPPEIDLGDATCLPAFARTRGTTSSFLFLGDGTPLTIFSLGNGTTSSVYDHGESTTPFTLDVAEETSPPAYDLGDPRFPFSFDMGEGAACPPFDLKETTTAPPSAVVEEMTSTVLDLQTATSLASDRMGTALTPQAADNMGTMVIPQASDRHLYTWRDVLFDGLAILSSVVFVVLAFYELQ